MGVHAGLAILAGVALGQFAVPEPIGAVILLALSAALLAALSAEVRPWAIGVALLLAAASWSSSVATERLARAGELQAGQLVVIQGRVAEPPVYRDTSSELRVTGERFSVDGISRSGELRVAVYGPPELALRAGDAVEVAGWVRAPQSAREAAYLSRLQRSGVAAILDWPRITKLAGDQPGDYVTWLLSIRAHAVATLQRSLPEPEASLAAGILVGERSGLPAELRRTFDAAGVSHLIAISGYNVAIFVAAIVLLLQAGLGRRQALAVALATLPLFVVLVGASAAVSRAAAMGGLVLVGLLLGRPSHLWTALALGCAALAVAEPAIVLDAGFQLSAAATAGIVASIGGVRRILTDRTTGRSAAPLTAAAGIERAARVAAASVLVTLATSLATTPIIAADFARLSLVAPVANLFIGWVMPVIMATSGLVVVAGSLSEGIGQAAAHLAWAPLAFFVHASRGFASGPIASIATGPVPAGLVAALYAGVAGSALLLDRRRDFGPLSAVTQRAIAWASGRPYAAVVPLLAAAAVGSWSAVLTLPPDQAVVRFLDVPGEAILLTTAGKSVLIDGGSSPTALLAELGRALPFATREIDLVIVTGTSADRTQGLRGLPRRYHIDAVIAAEASQDLLASLFEIDSDWLPQPVPAARGQRVLLGDSTTIEVASVGTARAESNVGALSLRLSGSAASVLLAGAASVQQLRQSVAAGGDLSASVVRLPQAGPRAFDGWPALRPAARATLEVFRDDGRLAHDGRRPVHRLGRDGELVIQLD